MRSTLVKTAIALAFGTALSTGAQAGVVSTLGVPVQSGFYCLGTGPSCGQTFGESFTVATSETTLSNFSFFLPSITGNSVNLKFELYAWSGTGRQGAALYESAPLTYYAAAGSQLASFDMNVLLQQGHTYMAYLDTTGVGNTDSQYTGFNVVANSAYTGGTFGWERNSGDGHWNSLNNFDAQFSATFTNGNRLPEPATLAIVGLGLAGVVLTRKRAAR